MCDACPTNWDPADHLPTMSDLTTADADLFEHDKRKPRTAYDPNGWGPAYTCKVIDCSEPITEGAWCVVHNARWAA